MPRAQVELIVHWPGHPHCFRAAVRNEEAEDPRGRTKGTAWVRAMFQSSRRSLVSLSSLPIAPAGIQCFTVLGDFTRFATMFLKSLSWYICHPSNLPVLKVPLCK